MKYDYKINGTALARVTDMRDLGVTFDSQLTFKAHISEITNKASKMYGFIVRKCRLFTNIKCIRMLYITYVRSVLEYCSVVWSPYYDNHKYSIEKIQNKFLRYIYYKETGIYRLHIPRAEVMKTYNLSNLESRRKMASIIFLHKLLNNSINDSDLLFNINFHVPSHRTRNPSTLYVDTTRTNYYNNSPIMVMCKLYNKIQNECDIFNISKVGLKKLLINIL